MYSNEKAPVTRETNYYGGFSTPVPIALYPSSRSEDDTTFYWSTGTVLADQFRLTIGLTSESSEEHDSGIITEPAPVTITLDKTKAYYVTLYYRFGGSGDWRRLTQHYPAIDVPDEPPLGDVSVPHESGVWLEGDDIRWNDNARWIEI